MEKDYNCFILLSNKQSVEEVLIERTVKTTIQILYDKGLIYNFDKSDNVLKDYLFVENRRLDFDGVYDVIQWFYSKTYIGKSSKNK